MYSETLNMEPLVPPSSGIEFPLEKVVTEVCTMSSKGPLQPCPEWPPRMKYCCIYTAPLPLSRPAFWVCYSADKSTSVQDNAPFSGSVEILGRDHHHSASTQTIVAPTAGPSLAIVSCSVCLHNILAALCTVLALVRTLWGLV